MCETNLKLDSVFRFNLIYHTQTIQFQTSLEENPKNVDQGHVDRVECVFSNIELNIYSLPLITWIHVSCQISRIEIQFITYITWKKAQHVIKYAHNLIMGLVRHIMTIHDYTLTFQTK